jgi:hypothetical protein
MVENTALNEADALARRHPIAAFSLDALTAGAAKLRPNRIALAAVPGQPARKLATASLIARYRRSRSISANSALLGANAF